MTQSEKKRLRYLIAILSIAVGVFAADQLGLLGDKFTAPTGANPTVAPTRTRAPNRQPNRPSPRRWKNWAQTNQEQNPRPLPLQALGANRRFGQQPERNIFVYYVPPEPPPPPPEPPPPLTITSLAPSQVYAGTGEFLLRVSGLDFPEDAQVFVNGRALPTTPSSGSELIAEVGEPLVANPGRLDVEVRNATGELYSDVRSVTVQAPRRPTYKFLGRLDDRVYLQQGEENRIEAGLGETIGQIWRVAGIEDDEVVLEDVAEAIGIRHTIALVDAAALSTGPISTLSDRSRFRPSRTNIRRVNPRRTQSQNQDENQDEDQEPERDR